MGEMEKRIKSVFAFFPLLFSLSPFKLSPDLFGLGS